MQSVLLEMGQVDTIHLLCAAEIPELLYSVRAINYRHFTKVERISDFGCAWRAFARHAHPKSGFSEMFRDLLIIVMEFA
jgi:hypothetical protein